MNNFLLFLLVYSALIFVLFAAIPVAYARWAVKVYPAGGYKIKPIFFPALYIVVFVASFWILANAGEDLHDLNFYEIFLGLFGKSGMRILFTIFIVSFFSWIFVIIHTNVKEVKRLKHAMAPPPTPNDLSNMFLLITALFFWGGFLLSHIPEIFGFFNRIWNYIF